MADEVEQTLHICREVHVYRIPPRSGADGYRSGEWKVADKIFSGRLRVVARGELCEVKIEDPSRYASRYGLRVASSGFRMLAVVLCQCLTTTVAPQPLDRRSSELFAICPVPFGKTAIAVEPVTDSSRYFVLRVEDPSTKRHAFLGMGFTDRGDAFDFKVALVRVCDERA